MEKEYIKIKNEKQYNRSRKSHSGFPAPFFEYLTGIPNWTRGEEPTKETMPELQGVIFTLKDDGTAKDIARLREPLFKD